MSRNILQTDHFRLDKHSTYGVLKHVIVDRRGPSEKTLGKMSIDRWRHVEERALSILEEEAAKDEQNLIIESENSIFLAVMPGREIAVLFWALLEDEKSYYIEGIFHGWRELAREERWWLFRKCSMPGQSKGMGWRKALFYALGDGGNHYFYKRTDEDIPNTKSEKHSQLGLFK